MTPCSVRLKSSLPCFTLFTLAITIGGHRPLTGDPPAHLSIGWFVNDETLEQMIYGLFRFINQKRAAKVCAEFKAAEAA